jgi:hypothetical protein
MRLTLPFTLPPELHRHRHEAVAVAIAAIGVGMFIGTSLIGPLVSNGSVERPTEISSKPSFEAMTALPDPLPYRTPTPAFEVSGAPSYAAAAKEKAQAELGGQPSADEDASRDAYASDATGSIRRTRGRYPVQDRHRPL